jgi:glycosyltransferase involved in cell wall biosynthesis
MAKGARKPPGAVHVSYVHAAMRHAWSALDHDAAGSRSSLPVRTVAKAARSYLRRWDRAVTSPERVDQLIASSEFVAAQIEDCYGREAAVVHPFVDLARFAPRSAPGHYYLVVVDGASNGDLALLLDAFAQLELPLWIATRNGLDLAPAGASSAHVHWLGAPSSAELPALYAGARALIVPGAEDFGRASLEALASGVPVIAYGAGSAGETVIDGVTGLLFRPRTASALADAVRALEAGRVHFEPEHLRTQARLFDRAAFQRRFLAAIRQAWLRSGKDAAAIPTGLPH